MEKLALVLIIIINVIIIIIGLYLGFLFIKSKSFNTYSCYNMIIFSFIIFIDNFLRIIPLNLNKKNCNTGENIIAFFIVFFDKLILATISMQALIYYFGVLRTTFYMNNEKTIFYTTLTISLVVSVAISGIYIGVFKTTPFGFYCYSNDTPTRRIIDDIFNSIYLSISLYSTIIPLMYVGKKKKEVESGLIEDLNYSHHFNRLLIIFIINTWTFVESFLIIYDKITGDYTDVIYLSTCLLIDLVNSINQTVYKETLKIFCKEKYNQKYNPLKQKKTFQDDE